jgi:hypothetical protein
MIAQTRQRFRSPHHARHLPLHPHALQLEVYHALETACVLSLSVFVIRASSALRAASLQQVNAPCRTFHFDNSSECWACCCLQMRARPIRALIHMRCARAAQLKLSALALRATLNSRQDRVAQPSITTLSPDRGHLVIQMSSLVTQRASSFGTCLAQISHGILVRFAAAASLPFLTHWPAFLFLLFWHRDEQKRLILIHQCVDQQCRHPFESAL